MKLQRVKGTQDFLPEQKILRNNVVALLQKTFELYGFNPVETPALEMQSTLTSKFAGGEEILKEIFTLKDNAQRELGLRYDLTVPFARIIAMNPQLPKPFKRYQIDKNWRNGPLKKGRYREFWQCDVDVVGSTSIYSEAELLAIGTQVFKQLKIPFVIKVNNRKLLDDMMEFANIPAKLRMPAILALDKIEKVGAQSVEKELKEKGLDSASAQTLLRITQIKEKTNSATLKAIQNEIGETPGIQELKDLVKACKSLGAKIELSPSLARGLAYYTGSIWEAFAPKSSISSSICGGGRYDNMIGDLAGSKEQLPAVGISFGLDTICDVLEESQAPAQSVVEVYVISMNEQEYAVSIAQSLREQGVRCDMQYSKKNMKKILNYVNNAQIPYAIIVGENEAKSDKVTLKVMKTGNTRTLTLKQALKVIKDD